MFDNLLVNIIKADIIDSPSLMDLIKISEYSEDIKCAHCSSFHIIKYGKYKNTQRYKCKCCEKTFSSLSKTLLSKTHYPEKWVDFLSCFQKSLSIRKCSELLDISVPTVFNWRHKVLNLISCTKNNALSGIVEIGELYFPESQKGNKSIENRDPRSHSEYLYNTSFKNNQIPVIVAQDRFNNIISEVLAVGDLNKYSLDNKLGHLLDSTNILCTSNLSAYVGFSNYKRIKHYRSSDFFNPNFKKTFNLENVTKYIKDLTIWMEKFNGVASKYLALYLTWFKLLYLHLLRKS